MGAQMDPFRILVLGNRCVGKTAFVASLMRLPTVTSYEETRSRTIHRFPMSDTDPNAQPNCEIWDIGARQFASSPALLVDAIRNADFIFLLYDVTDTDSLNALSEEWMPAVARYDNGEKQAALFIIGTKTDLSDQRAVDVDTAESMASSETFRNAFFLEISNADGSNLTLLRKVLRIRINSEQKRRSIRKLHSPRSAHSSVPAALYGDGGESDTASQTLSHSHSQSQVPPMQSQSTGAPLSLSKLSEMSEPKGFADQSVATDRGLSQRYSSLQEQFDSAVKATNPNPNPSTHTNPNSSHRSPHPGSGLNTTNIHLDPDLEPMVVDSTPMRSAKPKAVTNAHFGSGSKNFSHSQTQSPSHMDSSPSTLRREYGFTPAKMKDYIEDSKTGDLVPLVETNVLKHSHSGRERERERENGAMSQATAETFTFSRRKNVPFQVLAEFPSPETQKASSPGNMRSPPERVRQQAQIDHLAKEPRLYIDINIGDGRVGQIGIRDHDDPYALAERFVRTFRLQKHYVRRLGTLIQQKVLEYNNRHPNHPVIGVGPRHIESGTSSGANPNPNPHGETGLDTSVTHPRPFRFATEDRAEKGRGKALVKLHIELGNGKMGTVAVRKGDDPMELASNFVRAFSLPDTMVEEIAAKVKEQIVAYYMREQKSKHFAHSGRQREREREEETSNYSASTPRSSAISDSHAVAPTLFYMDVDLGGGRSARLRVPDGAKPSTLARRFATVHKLDDRGEKHLNRLIEQHLEAFMAK